MKIFISLIAACIIITAFSCNKSKSNNVTPEIVGEWKVTELITAPQIQGVSPETKTENNLGFVQTLVLKSDGTFIKSRTINGLTAQMTGQYTDKTVDGVRSISLEYPDWRYSPLHESCFATAEGLELKDGLLLNNFWPACDGPYILKYRKVK